MSIVAQHAITKGSAQLPLGIVLDVVLSTLQSVLIDVQWIQLSFIKAPFLWFAETGLALAFQAMYWRRDATCSKRSVVRRF